MNAIRSGLLVITLFSVGLLAASCAATSTPAPTPVVVIATPIIPNIIIATHALPPTDVPPPTATLFFDANKLTGRWQLDFSYRLRGYPGMDDIRYAGSVSFTTASDGTLSGAGTLYTTLDQPPCNTIVRENSGLAFTLGGKLQLSAADVVADLTMTPQDLLISQTFERVCKEVTLDQKISGSVLWPALTALDALHFKIPMQTGAALLAIRDLNGPSGGLIHGTLSIDIRLNR